MAHLPKLSWDVSTRYDRLPLEGVCFAEYIWLGAHEDVDIRSKTKTLYVKPNSLSDFPVWNFDGKSERASLVSPAAPHAVHEAGYVVWEALKHQNYSI